MANSFAYEITFELSSSIPRANGVRFVKNGFHHYVRARKEVIVSAGAFNTPKLLMLSGIGPAEELSKLNFVASWVDPSFMNNKIMADTILEIGGLAPRIAYAKVGRKKNDFT